MTKRFLAASTLSLAFAAALLAHEGGEHITGTVKALSATSITVETAAHEMKTVMLTPKTEAMMSGKKAAVTDLKPGERVVAEGVQKVRPGMIVNPKPYAAPAETAQR